MSADDCTWIARSDQNFQLLTGCFCNHFCTNIQRRKKYKTNPRVCGGRLPSGELLPHPWLLAEPNFLSSMSSFTSGVSNDLASLDKVVFHVRAASIIQKLSSYQTFNQVTCVENCCGDRAVAEVWNVECTKKANILAGEHSRNTYMPSSRGVGATKCLLRKSWTLGKELAICAGPVLSFRCMLHRCPHRTNTLNQSVQRSVGAQESSSWNPQRHVWATADQ